MESLLGYFYLLELFIHVQNIYGYHEEYLVHIDKNTPLNVHAGLSVINVSPNSERFTIHQPLTLQQNALTDLQILVTDDYSTYSGYYHYAKQITGDFRLDNMLLAQDGIDCNVAVEEKLEINSCLSTKGNNAHMSTRVFHTNLRRQFLTINVSNWQIESLGHVYLLVVANPEKTERNMDNVWSYEYMLNIVEEFNIPLVKRNDGNNQQSLRPAQVIVGTFLMRTNINTTYGHHTSLTGITLRRSCFRDGSRILTNDSNDYEITFNDQQRKNIIQFTVLFHLKSLKHGRYQCLIDAISERNIKLFRIRTNKMKCCQYNKSTNGYDQYLTKTNLANINSFNKEIGEHHSTLNSIWSKINYEYKQNLDYFRKQSHYLDIFIVFTFSLFVICILFAFCLLIWKEVIRRIEQKRREDLYLLETLKQLDPKPKHVTQLKYDVFISYSSKDQHFVENILLKELETRGYKCCYDPRDFIPGKPIVQSIAEGIFDSHKTLTVFSKDYLKSRWCIDLEFTFTFLKLIGDSGSSDSLVVVEYQRCSIDESLKENNYIKWDDKDKCSFFDELCKMLGPPSVRPLEVALGAEINDQ